MSKDRFSRYDWEILPHPPHSPDFAPSDYHLLGPFKCQLGGRKFEEDDDLIEEVQNWFKSLDANFYGQGIYSLISRWTKCIDRHGNYI